MKNTILVFLLVCATSCSFNRQFYQPDKFPQGVKEVRIFNKEGNDTVVLHFEGDDHRAYFTDRDDKPKNVGFQLQTVPFTGAKGNKLYGWFLKPNDLPNPKVTLLFLHGNGGNVLNHLTIARHLVQKGFQVFLVDYSGYGFSEGKPTRKNMVTDATAALNTICSRSDVKNTKVVIYGQSIGGHLAAEVARRNENKIAGLVMEGAPSSHKDIAAHMIHPFGFAARLLVHERYKAYKSVRDYHKPILVIHSSEDEVIPFAMGNKIYRNANSPKSFFEIKHEHIYGPVYYPQYIADKINGMLN